MNKPRSTPLPDEKTTRLPPKTLKPEELPDVQGPPGVDGLEVVRYLALNPPNTLPGTLAKETTAWLNSLGREGWELVGIDPAEPMAIYIFKRKEREL